MFVSIYLVIATTTALSAAVEMLHNFKNKAEEDFQMIRLSDTVGNPTRTIIIPNIVLPPLSVAMTPPTVDGDSPAPLGPPIDAGPPPPAVLLYQPFDEDDRFVLVSNSSYPPRPDSERGFASNAPGRPETPGPPQHQAPAIKRVRRRRRKKKLRRIKDYSDQSGEPTEDPSALKNSKFLNLFTIIRFPNDDCSDGGTCYTEAECAHLGGSGGLPCAKGYGICCMLTSRCGTIGEISGRVFRGLGEVGVCSLTIEKSACTKQIRLDFLNLELEPPTDGECGPERLLISGQNRNSPVPILCGSNSGQHVYLDVDEASGPVRVSIVSNDAQDFMIRVTQICEGNRLLAPKHCLQYYLDEEGTVESFNYLPEPSAGAGYLNNLDYAICIRKGAGMCSVMYSNEANGIEMPFDISNVDTDGVPTVPEGEAGAEVFNCPDDFIVVRNVRLCGQKVNDASVQPDFTQNAPVVDASSGPFMVSFVSDRTISGLGFRFKYKQIPC